MSWASIANNQCVSLNNLQDAVNNGVFTLKNIIPVPNTKQVTSGEAEFFVNIIPTGKSVNELVVKSNLVSPPTTTTTSSTSTTSTTTTFISDPCNCVEVNITSAGGEVATFNCFGVNENYVYATAGTRYICAAVIGGLLQANIVSGTGTLTPIGNCKTGPCGSTTTTTTTTIFNPTNNLNFIQTIVSRDDVTSSNDGKYVATICVTNNKLYISNDYGLTYTTVTVAGTNTLYRVAVSGTGEYMYCLSQAQGQPGVISRSTDYGVNWNTTGTATGAYSSITTNRTGQYVIVGAINLGEAESGLGQIWRSSDYGVSFVRVDFSFGGLYPQAPYAVTVDSSGNRQYAATINLSMAAFDGTVGRTTTALGNFTPKAQDGNQTYYGVSTSADGSKVVVANQGGFYGYSPGNVQLKRSIDYGDTYANFGGVSTQWLGVTIDGSGTNIIAVPGTSGASTLYKSVSFGTLSSVASSKLWTSVSISYNATVAIAAETTGLWRSTNGGSTWTKLS
jgi:hypothetical protein